MEIKPETRESLKFLAGFACLFGAMVMSFLALYIDPAGEIHNTVLILIAQVLVFIASLWSLSDFLKYKGVENKKEGV